MSKVKIKIFLTGVAFMILTSCNSMPTFKSFKSKTPQVNIKDYFNGKIEAWGIIQDRKGEVTRRFNVTMTGKWNGNEGNLSEDFIFDDGEKQKRVWTLMMIDDKRFKGTAADVIGEAEGSQEGNAINMKYILRLPVDGTTYDIKIDDWLILMDEKRLINISSLTKFGFNVGRLTIFFEKK